MKILRVVLFQTDAPLFKVSQTPDFLFLSCKYTHGTESTKFLHAVPFQTDPFCSVQAAVCQVCLRV
jgi:hypothetical protein